MFFNQTVDGRQPLTSIVGQINTMPSTVWLQTRFKIIYWICARDL